MLNWTERNTREGTQGEEYEDTKMRQNHADRGYNAFEDGPIEANGLEERERTAQAERSGMEVNMGAPGRTQNYSEESKVMANRQSFGETIESIEKVWARDRWSRIRTGELIGGERNYQFWINIKCRVEYKVYGKKEVIDAITKYKQAFEGKPQRNSEIENASIEESLLLVTPNCWPTISMEERRETIREGIFARNLNDYREIITEYLRLTNGTLEVENEKVKKEIKQMMEEWKKSNWKEGQNTDYALWEMIIQNIFCNEQVDLNPLNYLAQK